MKKIIIFALSVIGLTSCSNANNDFYVLPGLLCSELLGCKKLYYDTYHQDMGLKTIEEINEYIYNDGYYGSDKIDGYSIHIFRFKTIDSDYSAVQFDLILGEFDLIFQGALPKVFYMDAIYTLEEAYDNSLLGYNLLSDLYHFSNIYS